MKTILSLKIVFNGEYYFDLIHRSLFININDLGCALRFDKINFLKEKKYTNQ